MKPKEKDGSAKEASANSTSTKTMGSRRRLQRAERQREQQKKATVKGKVVKSAIDEYRRRQKTDNLQQNLQYMLGAKFVIDGAVTKEVLSQNRGRKALDRSPEKPKEKEAPSVFTDADFKRFEREYFGGGASTV